MEENDLFLIYGQRITDVRRRQKTAGIDANDLKADNDRQGHAAGDALLKNSICEKEKGSSAAVFQPPADLNGRMGISAARIVLLFLAICAIFQFLR